MTQPSILDSMKPVPVEVDGTTYLVKPFQWEEGLDHLTLLLDIAGPSIATFVSALKKDENGKETMEHKAMAEVAKVLFKNLRDPDLKAFIKTALSNITDEYHIELELNSLLSRNYILLGKLVYQSIKVNYINFSGSNLGWLQDITKSFNLQPGSASTK